MSAITYAPMRVMAEHPEGGSSDSVRIWHVGEREFLIRPSLPKPHQRFSRVLEVWGFPVPEAAKLVAAAAKHFGEWVRSADVAAAFDDDEKTPMLSVYLLNNLTRAPSRPAALHMVFRHYDYDVPYSP